MAPQEEAAASETLNLGTILDVLVHTIALLKKVVAVLGEGEAVEAMERCGMKYFIPCITQGGPGSLYEGTYKGLWDAIDKYNCEKFGFTQQEIEDARLDLQVIFG